MLPKLTTLNWCRISPAVSGPAAASAPARMATTAADAQQARRSLLIMTRMPCERVGAAKMVRGEPNDAESRSGSLKRALTDRDNRAAFAAYSSQFAGHQRI